ncbi:MAG: hypothetical protein ACUVT7_06960 [Thermoplasmata archaeon]
MNAVPLNTDMGAHLSRGRWPKDMMGLQKYLRSEWDFTAVSYRCACAFCRGNKSVHSGHHPSGRSKARFGSLRKGLSAFLHALLCLMA